MPPGILLEIKKKTRIHSEISHAIPLENSSEISAEDLPKNHAQVIPGIPYKSYPKIHPEIPSR